jgi:hypothetical protein
MALLLIFYHREPQIKIKHLVCFPTTNKIKHLVSFHISFQMFVTVYCLKMMVFHFIGATLLLYILLIAKDL